MPLRTGCASALLQFLSINLAAVILRQVGKELYPARILVESYPPFDKLFNLIREFLSGRRRIAQNYECLWLYQAVAGVVAYYGAFQDCLVLQQAIFNFRGRHKNSRDLQHVVSASVVPVVPLI